MEFFVVDNILSQFSNQQLSPLHHIILTFGFEMEHNIWNVSNYIVFPSF